MSISRIANPVTGQEEEIYVDKPTGFTATRTEMGMALVHRFEGEGLSWDYPGKYAEYSRFDYSGPPRRKRATARRRSPRTPGPPPR